MFISSQLYVYTLHKQRRKGKEEMGIWGKARGNKRWGGGNLVVKKGCKSIFNDPPYKEIS